MLGRNLPRRRFLQATLAAGTLNRRLLFGQRTASAEDAWVLLGTQTAGGIFRARWNGRSGTLGAPELAISTPRPTFLALHPSLPVVYACNEGDGDAATISAFRFDRGSATLTALGTEATHGNSPCFVSVDRTGQLLFAANYSGGSLAAFPLHATGAAAPAAEVFSCKSSGMCGTPGPVADRQDGPHLHCVTISPDNHFVLSCDLGDDAILAFPLAPGSAKPLGPVQRFAARAGSGPRHLAFHPNGHWLYCIHELDCTVDLYGWSATGSSTGGVANAHPVPGSTVPLTHTSAASTGQPNTAAEIAISRDGRFLYACTRGVDQLSVFRIDPETGRLKDVQRIACGGGGPRFFALDPSERWLVCTNQDGNNVTVFARDGRRGTLAPHGLQSLTTPQCVVWL